MQGIGKILKDEREKRGITLAEVAEATKIRTKYLDAIENDKFDVLPGEVYAKGFVTAYLKYLGIKDAPEVVEIMKPKPITLPEPSVEQPEPETTRTGSRKDRKRSNRSSFEEKPLSKRSSLIIVLSIVAILLLLAVQWVYSSQQGGKGPSQEEQQQQEQQMQENDPQQNQETEPQAPLVPETPVYEGLEMRLEIMDVSGGEDRCWMRITADGQATEVTLSEGQTQDVKATQQIDLNLGNAGAVRVTVNGQDLGTMGAQGEVVKRTFLAEDYGGAGQ